MTPPDQPREEPAVPGDPVRMALGALVASCYAGYRRAKQAATGPVQPPEGGIGDEAPADPAAREGGADAPSAPPPSRPGR